MKHYVVSLYQFECSFRLVTCGELVIDEGLCVNINLHWYLRSCAQIVRMMLLILVWACVINKLELNASMGLKVENIYEMWMDWFYFVLGA